VKITTLRYTLLSPPAAAIYLRSSVGASWIKAKLGAVIIFIWIKFYEFPINVGSFKIPL